MKSTTWQSEFFVHSRNVIALNAADEFLLRKIFSEKSGKVGLNPIKRNPDVFHSFVSKGKRGQDILNY